MQNFVKGQVTRSAKKSKSQNEPLATTCPSKLSKKELEDMYFKLLQSNMDLKKKVNALSDNNKLLSTKFQRISDTHRTYIGKVPKDCCAPTKMLVDDQRDTIADLQKSNEQLKEQVKSLNMKLCSVRQFLRRNTPLYSRHSQCFDTLPSTNKLNSSMSAISTSRLRIKDEEKENKDILLAKMKSVSCQCLEKLGLVNKSAGTVAVIPKLCDENRCRTLMEELKLKIVDLQQELSKTHSEYSGRITNLETEVIDLHEAKMRARTEKAERDHSIDRRDSVMKDVKQKLRESQANCDELTNKLTIEKNKVAEMQAQLNAANLASEAVRNIEEQLAENKPLDTKSRPFADQVTETSSVTLTPTPGEETERRQSGYATLPCKFRDPNEIQGQEAMQRDVQEPTVEVMEKEQPKGPQSSLQSVEKQPPPTKHWKDRINTASVIGVRGSSVPYPEYIKSEAFPGTLSEKEAKVQRKEGKPISEEPLRQPVSHPSVDDSSAASTSHRDSLSDRPSPFTGRQISTEFRAPSTGRRTSYSTSDGKDHVSIADYVDPDASRRGSTDRPRSTSSRRGPTADGVESGICEASPDRSQAIRQDSKNHPVSSLRRSTEAAAMDRRDSIRSQREYTKPTPSFDTSRTEDQENTAQRPLPVGYKKLLAIQLKDTTPEQVVAGTSPPVAERHGSGMLEREMQPSPDKPEPTDESEEELRKALIKELRLSLSQIAKNPDRGGLSIEPFHHAPKPPTPEAIPEGDLNEQESDLPACCQNMSQKSDASDNLKKPCYANEIAASSQARGEPFHRQSLNDGENLYKAGDVYVKSGSMDTKVPKVQGDAREVVDIRTEEPMQPLKVPESSELSPFLEPSPTTPEYEEPRAIPLYKYPAYKKKPEDGKDVKDRPSRMRAPCCHDMASSPVKPESAFGDGALEQKFAEPEQPEVGPSAKEKPSGKRLPCCQDIASAPLMEETPSASTKPTTNPDGTGIIDFSDFDKSLNEPELMPRKPDDSGYSGDISDKKPTDNTDQVEPEAKAPQDDEALSKINQALLDRIAELQLQLDQLRTAVLPQNQEPFVLLPEVESYAPFEAKTGEDNEARGRDLVAVNKQWDTYPSTRHMQPLARQDSKDWVEDAEAKQETQEEKQDYRNVNGDNRYQIPGPLPVGPTCTGSCGARVKTTQSSDICDVNKPRSATKHKDSLTIPRRSRASIGSVLPQTLDLKGERKKQKFNDNVSGPTITEKSLNVPNPFFESWNIDKTPPQKLTTDPGPRTRHVSLSQSQKGRNLKETLDATNILNLKKTKMDMEAKQELVAKKKNDNPVKCECFPTTKHSIWKKPVVECACDTRKVSYSKVRHTLGGQLNNLDEANYLSKDSQGKNKMLDYVDITKRESIDQGKQLDTSSLATTIDPTETRVISPAYDEMIDFKSEPIAGLEEVKRLNADKDIDREFEPRQNVVEFGNKETVEEYVTPFYEPPTISPIVTDIKQAPTSILEDKIIGTDQLEQREKPTQETEVEWRSDCCSKTYSIQCAAKVVKCCRATSPENTDQEISYMTDLPSERETPTSSPRCKTCKSQPTSTSLGENKATATYTDSSTMPTAMTTSTTPTKLTEPTGNSMSEGELPQTNPTRYRGEPRSPRPSVDSTAMKMDQALKTISEELARCRRLIMETRSMESGDQTKSSFKDSSAPLNGLRGSHVSLKATEGHSRIGDTYTPRVMFTLHIGTIVLSDEAVINCRDMSLVLMWQFYDQNVAMTRMHSGRVVHFDFSTEYDLKLTDDFLEYLKCEEMPIKICEVNHLDKPLASCSLPLREALLHTNRRADISIALMAGPSMKRASRAADALDAGDETGVLDLWCMLRATPRLLPRINKALAKPKRGSLFTARGKGHSSMAPGFVMTQINDDELDDARLSADLEPLTRGRLPLLNDTEQNFPGGAGGMQVTETYQAKQERIRQGRSLEHGNMEPKLAGSSISDVRGQVNFDSKWYEGASTTEGETSGIIVNEVPTSIKSKGELMHLFQEVIPQHDRHASQASQGNEKSASRRSARQSKVLDGSGAMAQSNQENNIVDFLNNSNAAPNNRKGYDFFNSVKLKKQPGQPFVADGETQRPSQYLDRIRSQSIDITILWLALNEECSAMNDPAVQRLYVAYTFFGKGGAELETPMSLPKPKHYLDKCHYNFKKSFRLSESDLPALGRMAMCRSPIKGIPVPSDCIFFTVVSEPVEDPLGLNNCEDIGNAHLYLGDLLAYSAGSDTYTEVVPVRANHDDTVCGVLAVKVDGLDVVRKCLSLPAASSVEPRFW